jgi:hypothetical protein
MFERRWLREGKKTQVTPLVINIVKSIPGEGLEFIRNASDYLSKIYPNREELRNLKEPPPDKRLRSANDILQSSRKELPGKALISGCIEIATVFRTLCIAKNIPAIFVEVINDDWKNDKNKTLPIQGHVFIDVYIDGAWHTINPANKDWHHAYGDYSIKDMGTYSIIKKGLDSQDLGFDNMDIFYRWAAKAYDKPELLKKL